METQHKDFYLRLRQQLTDLSEKHVPGKHRWSSSLLLAPDLFHLLISLLKDQRVGTKHKAILAGAIAYFINPFEVMPEAILGPMGYLDDVALASYALHSVINGADPAIAQQYWAGKDNALTAIQNILAKTSQVLGARTWGRLLRRFKRVGG